MFGLVMLVNYTHAYFSFYEGHIQGWVVWLLTLLYLVKMFPVIGSKYTLYTKDFFFILLYSLLAPTISQGIYNLISHKHGISDNSYGIMYDLIQVAVVFLLFLIIQLILLLRKNNYVSLYFTELTVWHYLFFSIALLVVNMLELYTIALLSEVWQINILSFICVIIVCILILIIIFTKESDRRKGYEVELLNEHMHELTSLYDEVIKKDNEMRKFRHDISNHFLILYEMIENGEYEEIKRYINELEKISRATRPTVDSGNMIADALISSKLAKIKNKGISFEIDGVIPGDFIENVDMVILLSNLLDNAVEACEKVAVNRFIKIESRIKSQIWFFSMKNSVVCPVKIVHNSIETSKADTKRHGYGIMNIKSVVDKYGGFVILESNEEVFTANIKINLVK